MLKYTILTTCIAIFAVLLLGANTHAAVYTVCSSGCDEVSISAAFSVNNLEPGDIVEVTATSPGGVATFYETINPGSDDQGVAGNPVIIRAREGDTIYIDGQSSRSAGIKIDNRDYITIKGFHLINHTGYAVDVRGSSQSITADGITIEGCNVISSSSGKQGLYSLYTKNLSIIDNIFDTFVGSTGLQTDNIYLQTSDSFLIDGNYCRIRNSGGSHLDNIQMYQVTGDVTIRNNQLIQDNNQTSNRQTIYGESSSANFLIYNNIVITTGSTGSNSISIKNKGVGSPGSCEIYNNSLYFNGSLASAIIADRYYTSPYIMNNAIHINSSSGYCIQIDSSSADPSRVDNNWCYKLTSSNVYKSGGITRSISSWVSSGFDINGDFADPRFISSTNLMTQSTSPLLNSGRHLQSIFTSDIADNDRGTVWDVGAYENLLETVAPNPPTGLQLNITN